jgi:hypothetical protein
MVKNLNPFWTKKFGSISGGMKYIPAAIVMGVGFGA